jgi:RHS repeat-associated protein
VQYVWSPVYVDALVLRDRDSDGDGTLDERLWLVQDANFTVTAVVDESGEVVERYIYDPFGQATVLDAAWNVRSGGSAYDWLYLHQGGRYDVTSGLYHFRHRDYSPTLGRWTSLDPLSYAAGDVNLYRTVGNNPLNSLDPSGLDRIDQIEVQGQATSVWYVDERLFRDDPRHYVGRLVIVNGEKFVRRRVGNQEYYVPLAKVEELTSYWSWEPTERSEWDNWFIQNGVNLWEPSVRNLSIQMGGVHGFTGYNDLAKAQAEIRGWAEIGTLNYLVPPPLRAAHAFTIPTRAVGTRPLPVAMSTKGGNYTTWRRLPGSTPAGATSRLVPGGGLAAHEAAGGHTIARHVGQTDAQLAARLAAEPTIPAASTFPDRATAERVIADALDVRAADLQAWLAGSAPRLTPPLRVTLPYTTGRSLPRGATATIDVQSVLIVLQRDASLPTGYRIVTAYPVP